MPSASHQAYNAGMAKPLSARISSVTPPRQRARTARTIRVKTATTLAGMDRAPPQHRRDELVRLAVEDEQREVLILPV